MGIRTGKKQTFVPGCYSNINVTPEVGLQLARQNIPWKTRQLKTWGWVYDINGYQIDLTEGWSGSKSILASVLR